VKHKGAVDLKLLNQQSISYCCHCTNKKSLSTQGKRMYQYPLAIHSDRTSLPVMATISSWNCAECLPVLPTHTTACFPSTQEHYNRDNAGMGGSDGEEEFSVCSMQGKSDFLRTQSLVCQICPLDTSICVAAELFCLECVVL
jgi:hypothetical protein